MTHHDTDDMHLKVIDEGDTAHIDQHFLSADTMIERERITDRIREFEAGHQDLTFYDLPRRIREDDWQ